MSLQAIQGYLDERKLELPPQAELLWRELRNMLIKAHDAGLLRTSHNEIHGLVRLLREPPPVVAEQLRVHSTTKNAYCIVGGEKNQDREHAIAHLKRSDGAWFDFTITVRQHPRELELLAYNFEIRFPSAMGTPFLRFDYNLPGHENELRSHLHAGSDDVYMPAPKMSRRTARRSSAGAFHPPPRIVKPCVVGALRLMQLSHTLPPLPYQTSL